jgi:hypothetical protein
MGHMLKSRVSHRLFEAFNDSKRQSVCRTGVVFRQVEGILPRRDIGRKPFIADISTRLDNVEIVKEDGKVDCESISLYILYRCYLQRNEGTVTYLQAR